MKSCRAPLSNGRACGQYLFQCRDCKSVGCKSRECKMQHFDPGMGRCFSCGSTRNTSV